MDERFWANFGYNFLLIIAKTTPVETFWCQESWMQKAANVILTALNDGEIEFRKSCQATVKLGSNKPDELIKGLSGCLEEILTKLESDLRKTYGQR